MKRIKLQLLVLVISLNYYSQIDSGFINHLTSLKLKNELTTYLFSRQNQNDTLHYYFAKFYLEAKKDTLLFEHYKQSEKLCLEDSDFIKLAAEFFLKSKTNLKTAWFQCLSQNKIQSHCADIYQASEFPNQTSQLIWNEKTNDDFIKYKKAFNKNLIVAPILSALIPGLGKVYAGNFKSGLISMALCASYIASALESETKFGFKNGLTVLNLSCFSVFYLSNIYGSYQAIKNKRKEYKKQFIADAVNYYH